MPKSLGKMRKAHGRETGLTHIKDLVPDPANRRAHNPRNIGMVVDSLQAVGAARSIVIDEDNVVLAGNGVTEAAAEAGITKVQVVEVDGSTLVAVRRKGLTAEQKRALAIWDNRTGELATWDFEQLQADKDAGLSLQPFWTPEEEAALLGKAAKKTGLTDPDAVPDVRATEIRTGDLFELGAHRLLCGDSASRPDVGHLLRSAVPSLMVTDPPYGVEYQGGLGNATKRAEMIGDDSTALYGKALSAANLAPNATIYLWYSDKFADAVYLAVRAAGFEVRAQIVWNKINPHYGAFMKHYMQKHEPCVYAVRGSASWNGPSNEVSVWDIEQPRINELHPTQKPVECMARPMQNHAATEVYEPFCGSGTSIIAAEQLSRTCYAIEIEPQYCQVIIDRFEQFTGQKAQKVGEAVRV